MRIELHPLYTKAYKKRIKDYKKLKDQTKDRINLFLLNPQNPVLRNHKLKGTSHELWSFSVGGDMRIIYLKISEEHVIFLNIGSHNQVY